MTLISLLVLVLVFGLLIYVVRMLPLEPPWNQVAMLVVVLIFVVLLLNMVAPMPGLRVW